MVRFYFDDDVHSSHLALNWHEKIVLDWNPYNFEKVSFGPYLIIHFSLIMQYDIY